MGRQALVAYVLAEAVGVGVVQVESGNETHDLDPAESEDDVLVVRVDARETCKNTYIVCMIISDYKSIHQRRMAILK